MLEYLDIFNLNETNIMFATKSNHATNATVTISPENSTLLPEMLVNGDFGSIYSVNISTSADISITFDYSKPVQYIAIGGSNAAGKYYINIYVDGVIVINDTDLSSSKNPTLVYRLDKEYQCKTLRIQIFGSGELYIADIACGEIYELKYGGQSGFDRPWSVSNVKSRSTTGLNGSPINNVYSTREIKTTLSISNMLTSDISNYREFAEFGTMNTFYMCEDDNPQHSYACFNAEFTTARFHESTTALANASVSFNAFANTKGIASW